MPSRHPGSFPTRSWTPAYDADGAVRDGAWVAELTGLLDLTGWPAGMRVIARKERPHPGAQLRFTDVDGHRVHRVRHQHPARPARRPGAAAPPPGPRRGPDPQRKDTGLSNLPLHDFAPEPDLVRHRRARLRTHRLDADARPHRPRPPVGTQTAAAAAVLRRRPARRGGRRVLLHLAARSPWATLITDAITRLRPSHPADQTTASPGEEGATPRALEPRPPGATAGPPASAHHQKHQLPAAGPPASKITKDRGWPPSCPASRVVTLICVPARPQAPAPTAHMDELGVPFQPPRQEPSNSVTTGHGTNTGCAAIQPQTHHRRTTDPATPPCSPAAQNRAIGAQKTDHSTRPTQTNNRRSVASRSAAVSESPHSP